MDFETIDALIQASATTTKINNVINLVSIESQLSHEDFCLQFSERVAKQYVSDGIDFKTADLAMNWLFGYSYAMEDSPGEMPVLAREIYEAFDDGEFHHEGDNVDIDPKLKYTLPRLAELLKALDEYEDRLDLEAYLARRNEETVSLEEISKTNPLS